MIIILYLDLSAFHPRTLGFLAEYFVKMTRWNIFLKTIDNCC